MNFLKPIALVVSAVALTATAHAMTMDPAADLNGDGVYSMDEMKAILPDLTEDTFVVVDTNEDGLIDEDELAAATEAGVFPVDES